MQSERKAATAGVVGKRNGRVAWWKKMFRPAAAMAGLIVAGAEAEATPVAPESGEYRSTRAVPEAWQVFARQLQQRFEQRLTGDSDGARRIKDYMVRNDKGTDAPTLNVVLRAWVQTDGKVGRLEIDGLDDAMMRIELRALLMDGGVGSPPPSMLQPVHLRLSLRAKEPAREGN